MGYQKVLYCPHCGNQTPHEVQGHSGSYVLMACGTCGEAVLYTNCLVSPCEHEFVNFDDALLVWPRPAELHPAVPARVQEIYSEAASIMRRSPNGFANQIRRAVEAICKDQGATKGSLAERIRALADSGVIPGALADMTEFLRTLGNAGSHDDDGNSVDPSCVMPMDEFFRAVIEYVYIAPFKVNEFKTRLDKAEIPF